jgi:hypothetical protein
MREAIHREPNQFTGADSALALPEAASEKIEATRSPEESGPFLTLILSCR